MQDLKSSNVLITTDGHAKVANVVTSLFSNIMHVPLELGNVMMDGTMSLFCTPQRPL